MKLLDRTGQRYGHWLVLAPVKTASSRSKWHCRCDCGTEAIVFGSNLKARTSLCCGCVGSTKLRDRSKRHGRSVKDRTYTSWHNAKQRVRDPNDKSWRYYGGRGITMTPRWLGPDGFNNFVTDMGNRPEGMTLDRRDPNGPYCQENCRWADTKTQLANRRHGAVPEDARRAAAETDPASSSPPRAYP